MWQGLPVKITYRNGNVEEGEFHVKDIQMSRTGHAISYMGIWSYNYMKYKKVLLNRSVKKIVFDFEKYFNSVSK